MANDTAAEPEAPQGAVSRGAPGTICVSVCLATPARVWFIPLSVTAGSNAGDAVRLSGLTLQDTGADVEHAPLGIFGKRVPRGYKLADGDRVEIYRSLTFDPKDSRRRRAQHRQRLNKGKARTEPQG